MTRLRELWARLIERTAARKVNPPGGAGSPAEGAARQEAIRGSYVTGLQGHSVVSVAEKRLVGEQVPAEQRRMRGTKLYLALSDLTPDQQNWFTHAEEVWIDHVDLAGQDFHIVHDSNARRWQVRVGQRTGPELPMDPDFDIGSWGRGSVVLRRRLLHLFMDRNEIPGQILVYSQKSEALFEKETLTFP